VIYITVKAGCLFYFVHLSYNYFDNKRPLNKLNIISDYNDRDCEASLYIISHTSMNNTLNRIVNNTLIL